MAFHSILKTADKVFTIVICTVLLLSVMVVPIDVYNFFAETDQYARIHRLDRSKGFWELQYLKGPILLFFGSLAGLVFIFYSLKNKNNKPLQAARLILVFSLTAIMAGGFYQWYLTGFDH